MSQLARRLISEKIKKLRSKLGLNREELSLRLDLDNSYISKLEKCRVNITVDRLEMIANFFGIHIREFFE